QSTSPLFPGWRDPVALRSAPLPPEISPQMYSPCSWSSILRVFSTSCYFFLSRFLPLALQGNKLRRLHQPLGLTYLVITLLNLETRKFSVGQNRLVQIRQIEGLLRRDAVKRLRSKRAEPIINVLHSRRSFLFVVRRNPPVLEYHVAGIPLPFVVEHGHQR